MLVDKKHLVEAEVEFFALWISDLDAIGYKWPLINSVRKQSKTSESKLSQLAIYFKAIEQEHSSNSNDNEKSLAQKQSQDSSAEKLKQMCKNVNNLEMDKVNKLTDTILVTWVKSVEDIELISKVINVHFSTIVVCFSSQIENTSKIDQFILTNTSGGISFIDSNSFKQCVYGAINMGFRQNTFLFAKNLYRFEFWLNDTKLVEPTGDQVLKYFDSDSTKVINISNFI